MSENSANDLRTDAYPSPPRNIDPEKPFAENNHSDESTYHKHSTKTKHTKTRPKTAKSNTVNMVNINNSTKVHVGDVNNYLVSDNGNSVVKPTATAKLIRTEEINSLLSSVQLVEEQHIDFVSGHITVDGWTKVAQCLHFSTGQIQQLHKRCESRGIREVVYTMLVEWKQKEPTSATLGTLGSVLWDNMEEEAANRLANKLFSTIK